MKSLFTGLLLLLASHFAMATPLKAGNLTIDGAWARSTAAQAANGAVYLTISNASQQEDKLTSVSVEKRIAPTAQIHQTSLDHGIMRMREMTDGVSIPADKPVHFEPGSYHIMLIGLKKPLEKGEHFDLTLNFEHAGKVKVPVEVQDRPADHGTHKTMSMN